MQCYTFNSIKNLVEGFGRESFIYRVFFALFTNVSRLSPYLLVLLFFDFFKSRLALYLTERCPSEIVGIRPDSLTAHCALEDVRWDEREFWTRFGKNDVLGGVIVFLTMIWKSDLIAVKVDAQDVFVGDEELEDMVYEGRLLVMQVWWLEEPLQQLFHHAELRQIVEVRREIYNWARVFRKVAAEAHRLRRLYVNHVETRRRALRRLRQVQIQVRMVLRLPKANKIAFPLPRHIHEVFWRFILQTLLFHLHMGTKVFILPLQL